MDSQRLSPFLYFGSWLESYFTSLYKFMGHREKTYYTILQIAAIVTVSIVVLWVIFRYGSSTKVNKSMKLISVSAVVYMIYVVVFNIQTFLTYIGYMGHQGRYLLFPTIVLYLYISLLVKKLIQDKKIDLFVKLIIVFSLLFFFAVFSPLATFIWDDRIL